MDKTQTTPPVALEEPGWGLDATLSDSSTPPRQIAPRRAGVAPESTKKRSRRTSEGGGDESEDEDTVEGMTIDTEPGSLSPNSDADGGFDSNDEDSDPNDGDPTPSQTEPRRKGVTTVSPHRLAKGSTTNPLMSLPLKKSTKLAGNSKLKMLSPPRPVVPILPTSKRSRSSSSKQAPASSQPKTLTSLQSTVPSKIVLRSPLTKMTPSNSAPSKVQNSSSSPHQPIKTYTPSNTQRTPVDPPNPTQPESTVKVASQSTARKTPPEKDVKGGPPDSIDGNCHPNPDTVASAKDPGPSRVTNQESDQNETPAESGNRPEVSPVRSPHGQSTQRSDRSDIESLYASPSPEKVVTGLEPIELDSDPDFEMMELMLLSHRGPSSQSQSIKKEPTAQSLPPSTTERPLKRQRSHSSHIKSSQAPTQTPQADSNQAKRPRVKGPHPSDSAVVLNDRRKHPEFWDLDGTVILQVDDVLFRVMRSTLSKASPWFQRLFSEELDHLEIMAGCPVYTIEEDFSHLDFANLLRGLENGLEYALNPPHYLRIVSIFRTASLLEFNTLRRWSLGCLEKQWPTNLPPPSKPSKFGSGIPWAGETLTTADRLDVPQLMKRAYWELCTRPEFGKIDAEVYDNEVEEIMPTRSRLSRSVLMDLARLRERLLPEWTRITRTPPIGVSCTRTTKTPSTSTSTTQPTPCSLDYANWHKVITEVEANDMTIDDRRMDPISALEVMIVDIDWEKEGGFCADCVKTWKVIWTKDREKIWKNLGDWLGLDIPAGLTL